MKVNCLYFCFASLLSLSLFSCENISETTNQFLVEFDDDFKSEYLLNEYINYDGLSVKDSATQEEVEYEISPKEGTKITTNEDVLVTISAPNYEDYTFTLDVNEEIQHRNISLNFYNVNDFHGSFIEDESNDEIGMSKLASYLKKRKEDGGIILSSGDMFQGGVESNLTRGAIVIDAMNDIGFDAMTVGNHEFDWGLDVLKENASKMDFPLLGANAFDTRTNERLDFLLPYTIVEKNGARIGIIGSGNEDLPSDITYSVSQYLSFEEQVPIIKEYSNELKTEQDCDVVILLAHDGGSYNYEEEPRNYKELTKISPKSNEKYVDAMFLGHDHDEKSGIYNEVPFAEGGSNGEYVSIINLKLEYNEDDYDVVTSKASTLKTTSSSLFSETDAYVDSLLDKYKDELSQVDEVICNFETYQSENDILRLLCNAMIEYANNLIDEGIAFEGETVSSAFHNYGGVRAEIESGDFTYRDLIKVVPFDNRLTISKLTKEQFYEWENQGDFYLGSAEQDGYTYVATINYLSDNKEYYPSIESFDTNVVIQDVFMEYLRAHDNEL